MNASSSVMQCPQTFIVTPAFNELDRFLSVTESENQDSLWIYKPIAEFGGHGVALFNNSKKAAEHAEAHIDTTTKLIIDSGEGKTIN